MKAVVLFLFLIVPTVWASLEQPYEGLRVLCVACSSGIGRSAALQLVEGGAQVVVSSRRLAACEEVVSVAAKLRQLGGRKGVAFPVVADAGSREDLLNLVQNSRVLFGGQTITSIVWAPTGLGFSAMSVHGASQVVADLTNQMEINVYGFVQLIGAVESDLIQNRGIAAVVTVSSIASDQEIIGSMPYSIAKAAQDATMRNLAAEYGPMGIRFNSVKPAAIITPIFDIFGSAREPMLKDTAWRHILGRNGMPDEVGEVMAFLLSSKSSFITGQSISVNGGSGLLNSHMDLFSPFLYPNGPPAYRVPLTSHWSLQDEDTKKLRDKEEL